MTDFNAGTEPVKEAALELYHRIQDVLPVAERVAEEWPPYPQLTMELTADQMERVRQAKGSPEERLSVTREVVLAGAQVIGGDGQVGRIFSARGFPRNHSMPPMPFDELVSSWEASTPTPTSRWVDSVCNQVMAVARDQFPTLRWQLMRGADSMDTTWYGPVLRYVKKMPALGTTEIDVVFCKFEIDSDNRARVGVPDLLSEE